MAPSAFLQYESSVVVRQLQTASASSGFMIVHIDGHHEAVHNSHDLSSKHCI